MDDEIIQALTDAIRPIEQDTAFIFLTPVTGKNGDWLVKIIDYFIAIHRFEVGPVSRIEIASGELTKKQRTAITCHAEQLGLPVEFTDTAAGQARRRLFPAITGPLAGKHTKPSTVRH